MKERTRCRNTLLSSGGYNRLAQAPPASLLLRICSKTRMKSDCTNCLRQFTLHDWRLVGVGCAPGGAQPLVQVDVQELATRGIFETDHQLLVRPEHIVDASECVLA